MLSVIVPIYNGELYLKEFIENVRKQTFQDFELILVNDGSKDNSLNICNQYKKIDSRIIVINKKNEGAGPARNSGIKAACGDYLMFVDCDDYFENNYFEILYNTISKNNVDLAICGQTNVIRKKKVIYEKTIPEYKEYKNKDKIRGDYIRLKEIGIADVLWNKIYSKKIIDDNNLIFPNLRRGQDTVFNINYFDKINTCITINKALYYYRLDSLKNIFFKFPKNHYEIINEENENIQKKLKEWGVFDNKAKAFLDSHFVRAVFGAVTNAFNPKWNFDFKNKYQYIKHIVEQNKVQNCCKTKSEYRFYERIEIFCIKNKFIVLLMVLLKVKICIKNFVNMRYQD